MVIKKGTNMLKNVTFFSFKTKNNNQQDDHLFFIKSQVLRIFTLCYFIRRIASILIQNDKERIFYKIQLYDLTKRTCLPKVLTTKVEQTEILFEDIYHKKEYYVLRNIKIRKVINDYYSEHNYNKKK